MPATVEEVWAVLEEAERFPAWWPGIDRVEPSVRRALAPGALWRVEGSNQVSLVRRRPQFGGTLLVFEVVPQRRLVFQLTDARIDAELDLVSTEDDQTAATLTVEAPRFSGVGRAFPAEALAGLAALARSPDA
ncbi:MAG TPA: SRPBCC domain-containing protein [Gaiellaceae bacterium]|nr:SRPBCC domain-containing protein [Gaiellaceae bacterium]